MENKTKHLTVADISNSFAVENILSDIFTELGQKTEPNEVQQVSVTNSIPFPSGISTEAKQDDQITQLDDILIQVSILPSGIADINSKDFSTETTLDSLKTDFENTDFATETTLSILPSGVAALNAKDFATQTTLAQIKTDVDKIPADPAKESGKLTTIDSTLTSIKNTDGIKKIVDTVTVSGTVTANAGTNLNTSALALESGGNLATLVNKDFATQTTLALIKTKTDNLDTLLSSRLAEDTFTGRTGEIQASPTANTVLERLKQIHDRIGDIATSPTANTLQDRIKYLQTQFDIKVTELRDAIKGTPAKSLSDIYSSVDELEARIGEISETPTANTLQDRLKNIYAAIDELEARLGEISVTPTPNTVLERIKQVQDRIGEVSVSPTTYTVQDRLKILTTLITSSSQDTTVSGSLTALNQTITLSNLQSKASVGIDISGTFSAKLVCEGSIDGTTWLQLELYESKYLAPFSGSIKSIGQFHADITGFSAVRIRISSYTSGTATVYMRASNATLDSETHGTLWQRYSSAGRGFTFTTNLITITGTAEVDFVLIKNPTGTEKIVRLYEFMLNIGLAGGAQSLKSTYRLYRNPTITVNGTTITVQKINPLGSFNPIVEVYTLPTITARGTIIQTFPFTQGVLKRDTDLARYIIDGSNLLITAEPATTNTEHAVSSAWAEVEA